MPIYMKVDGVKGNVTNHDHKEYSGTASGGVWKTTNFLTREPAARAALGQTKVKVFICPSDPGVVQISRISLASGASAVDGQDTSAKFKVEQLLNIARSQGPNGKLYIATDAGVYRTSRGFDGKGKLLVGTEGGVWRTGAVQEAANRMRSCINLKQLGIGLHNASAVEIIVTDPSGSVVSTHRLQNTTVSSSRHPGGVMVALGDGSVR